jgi:hypothetical protein
MRREDFEVDGLFRNAFVGAGHSVCFALDLFPNEREVGELLSGEVKKLAPLFGGVAIGGS